MSSNLLYVPCRTTQKIDLGGVISKVINEEYYQTVNIFKKDIETINGLRNKVYLAVNDMPSLESIEILQQYYVDLLSLLLKFPNDLTEFPWYSTLGYSISGPVTWKAIIYEQLNIVYNIGALYSQLAVAQSEKTDEGLKKAASYFQYSAGCFEFVTRLMVRYERLKYHTSFPADLQSEAMNGIRVLMLAQAQEMFWQKAVANRLKDSLISRLGSQVAEYYSESLGFCKQALSVFRSDWMGHLKVKMVHFEAVTQYRQAVADAASGDYGVEVARLRLAVDLSKRNLRYLGNVGSQVQEDCKSLNEMLVNNLRTSEKDNDLIYLKVVTPNSDLTKITAAPVVKSVILSRLESPLKGVEEVLFKDLLPYYVIQIAQAFRERQEAYLNQRIIEPIHSLNNIIGKFLSSRHLPASLESFNKSLIPRSLVLQIEEMKNLGGTEKIEESLKDIEMLALQRERALRGIQSRLRVEFDEDSGLRARYGTRFWNREKSEVAAEQLVSQVEEYESHLQTAANGDRTIKANYNSIKSSVEMFISASSEQLEQIIPDMDQGEETDEEIEEIVGTIRRLISKVNIMKNERKSFLEITEIKSLQMNILPKVIQEYKYLQSHNKGNNALLELDDSSIKAYQEEEKQRNEIYESVFENHIKGLGNELKVLEQEKKTQETLEAEIDKAYKEFESLKNSRNQKIESKREEFMGEFQTIYQDYIDLIDNLKMGLEYYNSCGQQSASLLKNVEEYTTARRIEARDLEARINSGNNSLKPTKLLTVNTKPVLVISPQPQKKSGIWRPEQGIKFDK